MARENDDKFQNLGELEEIFEKKKLPKNVKTHIRRLKQEGRLQEAEGKNLREREKKIARGVRESVYAILETDNPQTLLEQEVKLVWWLSESGDLQNTNERVGLIEEILESTKGSLRDRLENKLVQIRDEVHHKITRG